MGDEFDFEYDFGFEKTTDYDRKEKDGEGKDGEKQHFDIFDEFDLEQELGQFSNLKENKGEGNNIGQLKGNNNENTIKIIQEKDINTITNNTPNNNSFNDNNDDIILKLDDSDDNIRKVDFIKKDKIEDSDDSNGIGEIRFDELKEQILQLDEEIEINRKTSRTFTFDVHNRSTSLTEFTFLKTIEDIMETDNKETILKEHPRISTLVFSSSNYDQEAPLTVREIEELNILKQEMKNPKFLKDIINTDFKEESEPELVSSPIEFIQRRSIGSEKIKSQSELPLFAEAKFYEVEDCKKPISSRIVLTHEQSYTPYYKAHYYTKPHNLYRGIDKTGKPIFIAVEERPTKQNFVPQQILKAMIFSSKPISDEPNAMWALIPADCKSTREALINLNPVFATFGLQKVKDEMVKKDLFDFESKLLANCTKYKFGILYIKKDQVNDENKMFSNVETSKYYQDFLEMMGEKVELLNYKKFSGGLNTTENLTGTHSLYTTFRDYEVMFHVSTMIPFVSFDEQQLGRKKYLGNDIVVIVFCDDPTVLFNPYEIRSQFNHVFIVVTVDREIEGTVYYRVGVIRKPGVEESTPSLPDPPIFQHGVNFRNFLLTKLINSERCSMESAAFVEKMYRTKIALLDQVLSNHLNRRVKKQSSSNLPTTKKRMSFSGSLDKRDK
eukprot:TRINITY_DN5262_c0_g1_i2.p1 TRINITY_DN5262_c0_g1~~TRINITY_DN5262_c0_g1_i2.p1  ORF type:complete len:667 (-),score=181.45 TRINITY_DN5262_c0_g1_i2:45-2045(-)